MDTTFSVLPPAPDYNPVKQAIARADELGEKSIASNTGLLFHNAFIDGHHREPRPLSHTR